MPRKLPEWFEKWQEEAAEQAAGFSSYFQRERHAAESFAKFAKPYQDEYERFTRSARQWAESFRTSLSKEARDTYPILAQNGWYPDLQMPDDEFDAVVQLLKSSKNRTADRRLCAYFERSLSEISQNIARWFPTRREVVASAFWAHRRRRFDLSVPVLFAQADGICSEVIGEQMFKRRERRPALAPIIEAGDSFWAALLLPLTLPLPISDSTKQSYVGWNRHAVLHGVSVAYGTRANSCRAISLVNYAAYFLNMWRRSQRAAF